MDDYDRAIVSLNGMASELDHVTEAEWNDVGQLAISIITLRTKTGVDVNGAPFEKYTDAYAAERSKAGYGTKPDLVRTGHMMGAMMPVVGKDEVTIKFANPAEALKAAVHDSGVNKDVYVRGHSRGTHVDSKGRRVSRKEVQLDRKRKTKRVFHRMEQVDKHPRHMNIKRRHFFDITQPREMDLLLEPLGDKIISRVTKSVK